MITETLLDESSLAGVYIWAGESTLVLPPNPGRGGRNQHLATLLVPRIAGHDVTVLCGATDGTSWLQQVNALLTTGPTGTNVMDLVIAIKHGPSV